MILTPKRTPKPDHVIKIEGHKLNKEQNTKFVGVYLDNKISWKHRIDQISGKVSHDIGIIVKPRKFLTCESLKHCTIPLYTHSDLLQSCLGKGMPYEFKKVNSASEENC